MTVRADIAVLLRAGHSDISIARRAGCSRSTVTRARTALGLPPVETLRRIYAEAEPTGRIPSYQPAGGRMPTSPAQQAANRERLLAALRDAA